MGRIAEELRRASREGGIDLAEVPPGEAQELRAKIVARYSRNVESWPLWERGAFGATYHDAEAWRWIGEFVGPRGCYLLFNPEDDDAVFLVQSGDTLTRLLSDSFGFEFYVTDVSAGYVFCFNHHDVLLAGGGAETWLKRRTHMDS